MSNINRVVLTGRLTKDIELQKTKSSVDITRFTLAVNRMKNKNGDVIADFVSCIAFDNTAKFLYRYCHKGDKIGLTGKIQTGKYDKNGMTIYTTDIIADSVELESQVSNKTPQATNAQNAPQNVAVEDYFQDLSNINISDEDLPF